MLVPADPRGLRAPRVWGPGAGGPGDPGGHERPGWVGPSSLPDAWQARGRGRSGGLTGAALGQLGWQGAAGGASAGVGGEEFERLGPGCGPGARPGPCGAQHSPECSARAGGPSAPLPPSGRRPHSYKEHWARSQTRGVAHPHPNGLLHLPCAIFPSVGP